ncbi:MAG: hypothetical protein R3E98_16360 [Gemmatimonadota bacterium]
MPAFLSHLLLADSDPGAQRAALDALSQLPTLRHGGDRSLVARAEADVARDPTGSFAFDEDGTATLQVSAGTWRAGRLEAPSIAELRTRLSALERQPRPGRLRFFVLEGSSPLTDIGWLQATAPEGCLFQVASQFNCLESSGPYVTPVHTYLTDPTQGPRAAIGAFPAALLRHYRAPGPDGSRFVQTTAGPQIDLLGDVAADSGVRGGYLQGPGSMDAQAYVEALAQNQDRIRIGVHREAEVVLGADWDGGLPDGPSPIITQVLTSTVAGGLYGGARAFGPDGFERAARVLLPAAYVGTLLTAVQGRCRRVVLTLIGGGVFGNPVRWIWDAIVQAMDEVEPLLTQDLDVVLNGREIGQSFDLDRVVRPEVEARGGRLVRFGDGACAVGRGRRGSASTRLPGPAE